MVKKLALLALLMTLTGCSSLPFSFLKGSGTNVAANTQVGKENRQALVSVETAPRASRDVVQKTIDTDKVETIYLTQEKIPTWLLVMFGFLCGFVIPSHTEIARWILKQFGLKL